MNILLTINDISITGGAERVCANLADALSECGHSVEILSFYRQNPSLPYGTQGKLTFMHDFGEDILKDKMLSNPIKKLYFKNLHKVILALKVWQKYKHIDAIITNDWTYMPIFKRKRTRYIKIQHLRFEKYNKRNNLFDTLIILTAKELNIWQRYHNNIKVIPNFLPNIPQVSTNHSQKFVLSVGRMDSGDQKGFLRLLDIWKIVRDRISSLRDESMDSPKQSINPRIDDCFARLTNPLDCHENPTDFLAMTGGDLSLLCESNAHDSSLQNPTNRAPSSSLRVSETNEAIQTYCHSEGATRPKNPQIKSDFLDSSPTAQNEESVDCFGDKSPRNDGVENDLNEWQLIIVGDGVLKSEIESKIRALNLQDSVILKPFTKDIEREYLGASIYAMASHFEGFPMVLLESTAYGLAPISFDIATGPSDIIEHNKSGFLVADNDLESYADKLIALMNDESMRIAFGSEAKRIVSERFSKEVVIRKWEEVFKNN